MFKKGLVCLIFVWSMIAFSFATPMLNPVKALHNQRSVESTKASSLKPDFTDFSGHWVGHCSYERVG